MCVLCANASAEGTPPFLSYEVKGLLGKGTYGKVLRCTHRTTSVTVAIKVMTKEDFLTDQFASEVSKNMS